MDSPIPNCIYIGADKSGSTWVYHLMRRHPDMFVTPAKDTYFFDREFHRGVDWYRRQFRGWSGEPVVAEICHDYMYDVLALERIAQTLPDVTLVVNLREPGERALSAWRYLQRHERNIAAFSRAVELYPGLVDHGRYATALTEVLTRFPRDRVWIGLFDDLRDHPDTYAANICTALGVDNVAPLPGIALPAGKPRSPIIASWAKRGASLTRSLGLARLVGRVKLSPWVQNALYAQGRTSGDVALDDERDLQTAMGRIRMALASEVRWLEDELKLPVRAYWPFREYWHQGLAASRRS